MMSRNASLDMIQASTLIDERISIQEKRINDEFRKAQIERIQLMFLVKCKDLKRPPPTLRLNGCNGLINRK